MKNALLVAVGGNSLIRAGQRGTISEQIENARITASHIADLAALGYRLVITHGNGPQVGSQLLRSEAGSFQTYTQPLDICVAATQGEIGYVLQNALRSELRERRIPIPIATIVTQVKVDKSDPAFQNPSKPVGPFYDKEDAEKKRDELGWHIVEDAARGYRRVVPSPKPMEIVEIDAIRLCVEEKIIVIAVGGGGIPIVAEDGTETGIEAVIDKDMSSALLAVQLGLKSMVISTDTDCVYLNYKKAGQKALKDVKIGEIKEYLEEGQFAPGSMRPKIESAIEFISHGGEEVIITSPHHLVEAVGGEFGTHIRNGG